MGYETLPRNSTTKFEKSIADTVVRDSILAAGIEAARSAKFVNRPTSYLPWLVIEYGLGEISKYFQDQNDLIDTGIPWQRTKGTPIAIKTSLAWIGYASPVLFDDSSRRRMWNRYQIKMALIPTAANEDPLLYDAEYLATISSPIRSIFWRGYEGYDVRTLEWGGGAWGETMWGDDSGVRMPDGSTKWSHGVDYDIATTLTSNMLTELSVDVVDGDTIGWLPIPWNTPGVTWDQITDAKAYKAFLMTDVPAYLGFYDVDDEPIGYRRIYGAIDVTDQETPVLNTAYVEYQARTDFGDGFGSSATQVAVLFHARPTDHDKPGRLWLAPGEIEFDPAYNAANLQTAMIPLAIDFRRTVREHVTITVEV